MIDLIMKNRKRLDTVNRGDFCLTNFQPNINKVVLKHQVAKCNLTSQNYLTFCIFLNKQHNSYISYYLYYQLFGGRLNYLYFLNQLPTYFINTLSSVQSRILLFQHHRKKTKIINTGYGFMTSYYFN